MAIYDVILEVPIRVRVSADSPEDATAKAMELRGGPDAKVKLVVETAWRWFPDEKAPGRIMVAGI